jgi:hypothetical protein
MSSGMAHFALKCSKINYACLFYQETTNTTIQIWLIGEIATVKKQLSMDDDPGM